jgi:hypothetical protein
MNCSIYLSLCLSCSFWREAELARSGKETMRRPFLWQFSAALLAASNAGRKTPLLASV